MSPRAANGVDEEEASSVFLNRVRDGGKVFNGDIRKTEENVPQRGGSDED